MMRFWSETCPRMSAMGFAHNGRQQKPSARWAILSLALGNRGELRDLQLHGFAAAGARLPGFESHGPLAVLNWRAPIRQRTR